MNIQALVDFAKNYHELKDEDKQALLDVVRDVANAVGYIGACAVFDALEEYRCPIHSKNEDKPELQ